MLMRDHRGRLLLWIFGFVAVASPAAAWAQCVLTETQKLTASGGDQGDQLGWALATAGDRLVGGAPFAEVNDEVVGAAYVYRYDGQAWIEEAALQSSDGAVSAYYAKALATDGDVIAVGASNRANKTGTEPARCTFTGATARIGWKRPS